MENNNTEDNKELSRYTTAVELWDKINQDKAFHNITRRIAAERRRKIIGITSGIAAAVIAAIVIIAPFADNNKIENATAQYAERVENHVKIVSETGEEFLMDDATGQMSLFDNQTTISKDGNTLIINQNKTADKSQRNEFLSLVIPRGCEYHIVLSDGSNVWLNAESTLKFQRFFDSTKREVSLTGEACFDIAHDKSRPFSVKVNGTTIKVLGTLFNISAYPEKESVVTTLIEGSISQSLPGSNHATMLKPSQQSSFNKKTGVLTTESVDVEDFIAWREGKFIFRNQSLDRILTDIGRVFNYNISINENIVKTEQFHLMFCKNDDITAILNKLRKVGDFNYQIEADTIIIYKQ